MKLLSEVLNGDRVEAVHDLRVWSRRLQEILKIIFSTNRENGAAALIRALRRARRSLSEWRDSDVLLALLDRRIRRLQSDERRAWEAVRAYLVKKREKQIHRARQRIAKRELFVVPRTIEDLLKQQPINSESNDDPVDAGFMLTLSASITAAYADWQAALALAIESSNQADTHRFRIQTKRLRYRLELARDLGHKELQPQLIWLKALQDKLGEWHDRAELAGSASLALANADFLFHEPRAASLLLRRLARQRSAETAKLKSLLGTVSNSREVIALESWTANQRGAADSYSDQSSKTAVSG